MTLSGAHVRLEPLSLAHVADLARVGLEPELWRLQPAPVATREDMRRYVEKALEEARRGVSVPFAIVDLATRQIIGSTRYMDIAHEHRRLEIGCTWLTSAFQRTPANTEAKLLLLTYAFETAGVIRVVLKTETLNERSRRAIERLGAVQEGIFRKHLIAESGRPRDMVYYAILAEEWPAVKERLTGMLR